MIKITVDDREVRRMLKDLAGRVKDMRPVMRKIAGIMHDAVEENFEAEGRPKWKSLSRATLEKGVKTYKKSGKHGREGTITKKSAERLMGRKILQDTGQLAASISPKYTKDSAMVGTNKVYAAIHHFGGDAGRGRKVTIPARPFLKLTDGDLEDIKEAVRGYLKQR